MSAPVAFLAPISPVGLEDMADNPKPSHPIVSQFPTFNATRSSIASIVRPYAHSPYPAWGLASLFFGSVLTPRGMSAPPLVYRAGFGAIFSGAGYILSCGDVYNGSSATAAWSFAYLIFHFRNAITSQHSPVSLRLTAATTVAASLYGVEYFILQDSHSCASERLNPLRVERSRHLRQTTKSDD